MSKQLLFRTNTVATAARSFAFTSSIRQQHDSATTTTTTSVPPVYLNHSTNPALYRCSVDNPLQHTAQHLNKFYRLNNTDLSRLDPFSDTLSKDHYAHIKAFDETCLMIREPATEIMSYMKDLDLEKTVYKFMLYGHQNGTGKRSTLLHLLHYCMRDNWLLIHLPNCSHVLRKAQESQPSTYKEGRLDTPIDATLFLKRFSIQNADLLKSLDMRTTREYKWSARDVSPEGTPIVELLEYASNRIKYSSDICGAIIREIKLQAQKKGLKVFICVDQVNSFFGPTRLRRADKSEILADEVTIVRNFKKLLDNDWSNAVIAGSCTGSGHIIQAPNRKTKCYDTSIRTPLRRRTPSTLMYDGPLTPLRLLGRQGFYRLEPFVPVEVADYSDRELLAQYEYYKDRQWLQNPEALTDDGREELAFLSGRNPAEFMRVCQTI